MNYLEWQIPMEGFGHLRHESVQLLSGYYYLQHRYSGRMNQTDTAAFQGELDNRSLPDYVSPFLSFQYLHPAVLKGLFSRGYF